MAWLEITVKTGAMTTEDVAARLTAAGFADLVIEDQGQFEEFLEENRAYWDYIDEKLEQQLQGLAQIKLYLEDSDKKGFAHLEEVTKNMGLTLSVQPMAEVDWSETWKDNYPPVQIGRSLVVLPCWLADEDHSGRKKVILDPGLTFGTGTHPSTQMVLRAMEDRVQPGSACLDLGSGSGILSIAALRLGAKCAAGVDIDPKAEDIARENAAYNGFGHPEFTALTGNVTTDRPLMARLAEQSWDVVLVNIVADVICGLAPVLPRFLGEKTVLICSGILDSRLQDVKNALTAAGISVTETFSQEDWRCITAQRR